MDIGNPFKEEQGEYVSLKVGSINRPAQDVGRFPEVGFKLWQRKTFVVNGDFVSFNPALPKCPVEIV